MKKIFLLPLSMIFLTTGYADELPAAHSVEVAESDSDVAKSHDNQGVRPGKKGRNANTKKQNESETQSAPSEKKSTTTKPSKPTPKNSATGKSSVTE